MHDQLEKKWYPIKLKKKIDGDKDLSVKVMTN